MNNNSESKIQEPFFRAFKAIKNQTPLAYSLQKD